jgi:addiction module RelE/StbE family toxin
MDASMRQIIWTEAAFNDIERIAEYIAIDSPAYAAAFVRRTKKAASSLDIFPERGRKVPEFDSPTIRELIVGNYRLIYLINSTTLHILTVVHTSRDLDGLLESLNLTE